MSQGSLRVLVADDDRDTVLSLLMLLRQWGYDGVAAYDGPGALDDLCKGLRLATVRLIRGP